MIASLGNLTCVDNKILIPMLSINFSLPKLSPIRIKIATDLYQFLLKRGTEFLGIRD